MLWGFPGDSGGRESACSRGNRLIPGLGLWHQLKRHNWSQKDPYSKWPIHKADSLGLLLARSLVPLHVGLSANSSQNDDQTPRLRVPREQGRRAWQSVTSIVLHGTRQSQRPAWRRGTDFTSYRGSGMVLVAHVE